MTRWLRRATAASVVLLLAMSACSGDDDNDRAEGRTTSTTASTAETRQNTLSTTTTAAEGPAEWVAIAQNIYDRRHRLRTRPDPDAIASVISEDCDCYEAERSTVEFFVERSLRYESRPNQVLSVAVRGRLPDSRLTFLLVEVRPFMVRLYNPDGTLFQETEAPAPGQVNLAVAPTGPNGEWRIHDLVSLDAEN